jgi:hypothetical protein
VHLYHGRKEGLEISDIFLPWQKLRRDKRGLCVVIMLTCGWNNAYLWLQCVWIEFKLLGMS